MPLAEGDTVFVPKTKIGENADEDSPFARKIVRATVGRSIQVDVAQGQLSDPISTKYVHENIGVAIFRFGDYSEGVFLDPLYKSILQFSRLLLPDDFVYGSQIRTLEEFGHIWRRDFRLYTKVIFIGHGSPNSIRFGNHSVPFDQLISITNEYYFRPMEFISLCCETGKGALPREFSKSRSCKAFIGPYDSVHACIASQFAQIYLTKRLLEYQSTKTAARNARKQMSGSATFRLWRGGKLEKLS